MPEFKWIKTSDGLPPEATYVMVYFPPFPEIGALCPGHDILMFSPNDGWVTLDDSVIVFDTDTDHFPVAWAFLPPPPPKEWSDVTKSE